MKTLNFGKRQLKWQDGRRELTGRSRDVIYIQPLIFSYSLLPQRCVHSEACSFSISLKHIFRYFLLGVWGGLAVLWVTDWTLKWAPFFFRHCSFPAPSSPCFPCLLLPVCGGDEPELFVIKERSLLLGNVSVWLSGPLRTTCQTPFYCCAQLQLKGYINAFSDREKNEEEG